MRFSTIFLRGGFLRNFPKKYIEKEKNQIPERIVNRRFGAPPIVKLKVPESEYHKSSNRPWTQEAKYLQREALRENLKPVVVEQLSEDERVFLAGDRVEVMVGRDKGKHGIVIGVDEDMNHVYVQGMNLKYEMIEGSDMFGYDAQMTANEQPLDFSKKEVALLDPKDLLPTEVKLNFDESGERVRVSVRSGYVVPFPMESERTYEYSSPITYEETDQDTTVEEVTKVTYSPKLCLFEDDILHSSGKYQEDIEQNRKYQPSYWY